MFRKSKLMIFIGIVALIIFFVLAARNICAWFGSTTVVCRTIQTLSFSHAKDSDQEYVPMFDANQ